MTRWIVAALALAGCAGASPGGDGGTDARDAQAPADATEAYLPCAPGGACGGGTACVSANVTATGNVGSLCSRPCAAMGDCLLSPRAAAACVVVGGQGVCYLACATDGGTCPAGSACVEPSRQIGTGQGVCVPP